MKYWYGCWECKGCLPSRVETSPLTTSHPEAPVSPSWDGADYLIICLVCSIPIRTCGLPRQLRNMHHSWTSQPVLRPCFSLAPCSCPSPASVPTQKSQFLAFSWTAALSSQWFLDLNPQPVFPLGPSCSWPLAQLLTFVSGFSPGLDASFTHSVTLLTPQPSWEGWGIWRRKKEAYAFKQDWNLNFKILLL